MKGNFKQPARAKRGLVPKGERAGGLKNISTYKKIVTGVVPVFFVAFVAAFAASSVFTPTESSDASNLVTANLVSQDYYVKINSSDVAMSLISTPGGGAMTVVNSTVKAATNSPKGYQLYLGMSPYYPSGDEKSAADKLKNGLYLDGNLSRQDGEVVNAVSGTAVTSGLAALTDNTWGYAIDKNTTGAPDFWTTEDHSTMSSATPTNDKFAAVPAVGSDDLIQVTHVANVSEITPESAIDFDDPSQYTTASVYYGIRGTMARASGAYSNTIAYTAIVNDPTAGITSFTPATYTYDETYETKSAWTDQLVIQTSIYTNMRDLGTATVTLTGGPQSGSYTCSNPTLATVDNLLTVTCTLPQAYAGEYDISVVLDKFSQTLTDTYTYAANWNSIYAMQDMTSGFCSAATLDSVRTLKDNRDTHSYTVKKLKDNHCWMTENLNYIPTAGTELTPNDSNVSSSTVISTITDDCSDANIEKYCIVSAGRDDLGYGTYYNWYAATAGTGRQDSVSPFVAPSSICPKSFRLPTGDPSGEYQTLYNNYNSYTAMTNTAGPQFVLGGWRYGTSPSNQGTGGRYWSSSAYTSATYAYGLRLRGTDSAVYPAGYGNKRYGFSLRCLAQ